MNFLKGQFTSRLFAFLLYAAFLILVIYALPATTANLHFTVDDWDFMQLPFFNDLFSSVLGVVFRKLRIGRELFWVFEVKLFGVNREAMHYVSITLHTLNAFLFAACTYRAFPNRPSLSLATLPLSLAFPSFVAFSFVAQEMSRLTPTLVFLSLLCFQAWERKPRPLWLVTGGFLFFAAQTVYESMLLLIAVLPVFAMAPRLAAGKSAFRSRQNWYDFMQLSGSMLGAGLALLLYRYALQFGDKARGFHAFPTWDDLVQTLISTGYYVVNPLAVPPSDILSLTIGISLFAATLVALLFLPSDRQNHGQSSKSELVICVFLGLSVTILGLIPYILAQLGRVRGDWVFEERILSSAGYGIILLLAAPAALLSWKPARLTGILLVSFLAGSWLTFGFGLRLDWSEAAERNCRLWTSLLEQVPAVKSDTVFLFYDLNESSSRAVVFGGQDPLFVLMKMLYQNRGVSERIYAYQLYGKLEDGRFLASATPQGFSNAFSQFHNKGPVPQERLILVRRHGDRLVVEDRFTPDDPIGIHWLGVEQLTTNRNLIMPAAPDSPDIAVRLDELSIHCAHELTAPSVR